KIDGNFIKNLVENPVDVVMVEAITKIGHVMGIKTIAEYVESETVMEKLRELGVDCAQGYYLGKPQPFNLPSACVVEEFALNSLEFETKLAS
ncbi:MAG: EAL domain-containing protein, partial [Oscillatoriales cyanobacterium RU_3_3]|nr:EAL domain-containing protein [Oscillatoriales cyanobacterium RU_3_3]